MVSRSTLGSLILRIAVPLTLAALVLAPRAFASSVVAPTNVFDRADVQVSLTASDPAGLAMLFVDSTLARSFAASGAPASVSFPGLPLAPGPHQLRLLIRSRSGIAESPACSVVAWQKPVPPLLLTPKGGYASQLTPIVVKAGPGTASLKLTLNGKVLSTKSAAPGQVVSFGNVTLAGGVNTLSIAALNPVSSTTGTFKVRRLDFPWPTCIVIDKSEFRLYWVRNGVLVKTYPVAIGKPSTPTPVRNWRVGDKYEYAYGGVYGPRRLRLYKQVGPNSFQYSNYGVHGTNQEWVIGTMASHGCIRMFNRDVLELYPQVPLYTMVQTRD